jgi:hypothetical protein
MKDEYDFSKGIRGALIEDGKIVVNSVPHSEDLISRLRKRAEIRRQIPNRKSVQEGKSDRIADLLDEAANTIEQLMKDVKK